MIVCSLFLKIIILWLFQRKKSFYLNIYLLLSLTNVSKFSPDQVLARANMSDNYLEAKAALNDVTTWSYECMFV